MHLRNLYKYEDLYECQVSLHLACETLAVIWLFVFVFSGYFLHNPSLACLTCVRQRIKGQLALEIK